MFGISSAVSVCFRNFLIVVSLRCSQLLPFLFVYLVFLFISSPLTKGILHNFESGSRRSLSLPEEPFDFNVLTLSSKYVDICKWHLLLSPSVLYKLPYLYFRLTHFALSVSLQMMSFNAPCGDKEVVWQLMEVRKTNKCVNVYKIQSKLLDEIYVKIFVRKLPIRGWSPRLSRSM